MSDRRAGLPFASASRWRSEGNDSGVVTQQLCSRAFEQATRRLGGSLRTVHYFDLGEWGVILRKVAYPANAILLSRCHAVLMALTGPPSKRYSYRGLSEAADRKQRLRELSRCRL